MHKRNIQSPRVIKDYAPYFEEKKRLKDSIDEQLLDLDNKLLKIGFLILLIVLVVQTFIK